MGKSKVIPVRLDPETHQLIERAATVTGQTVSGYIRHVAQLAAQRDTAPSHPALAAERRRLAEKAAQAELPIRPPK
jgi:uncharacterized protein (DUF1778 family)